MMMFTAVSGDWRKAVVGEGSTSGTSTPAVVGTWSMSAWSPFGEADQMPPLPDFPSLLRAHDADRSGTISQSELDCLRTESLRAAGCAGRSGSIHGRSVSDARRGQERRIRLRWNGRVCWRSSRRTRSITVCSRLRGGRPWRCHRIPGGLARKPGDSGGAVTARLREPGGTTCATAASSHASTRPRVASSTAHGSRRRACKLPRPIAAGGRLFVGSG